MKRKSIKTEILILSISVLIIGISIMIAVVGLLSTNTTNNLTRRLMEASVNEYSNEFKSFSQDVYGAINTVVPIIANFTDSELVSYTKDPRGEVIDILSKVLMSNDKITAMWTCWEPDAFDGKDSELANTSFYDATGRFTIYVYREGNNFKVDALGDYESLVEGDDYQETLKSCKPFATDPYMYNIGGKETEVYSIAIPVIQNGKMIGVVGADIDLRNIMLIMNSGNILDDGYFYTISPNGFFTTHSNEELLLQHYDTTWMKNYSTEVEKILANGGKFEITKAYSDITDTYMTFFGSSVMIGDTGHYWVVCGVVPEETVNASSTSLIWTIVSIGFFLIVLVGISIFFIINSRLKILPAIANAAHKISEGDFSVSVKSNRNDEISEVANALLNVKEIVQKLVRDINNMSGEFKAGDIESKIEESAYKGEFQVVAREINNTFAGAINDTLEAIREATEFGNGNFDVHIQEMPGKKEILTTSFKTVQKNLKKFSGDINNIIAGATNGNLDVNMDVSQYKGDWNKMAAGINGLLAAVVKPIREAIDVLNQLSSGNLNVTVNGDYKGEFAAMKSALNSTLKMLASYIKEISTVLSALSQDNLDQAVEREYVGEFSAIKTALNTIIDKFNKVISEIASAADQVAIGAKQIADSSMTLAKGATEQASAVEELNATVSVINKNTVQNAKNAEEAEVLSNNSKINAANGNHDMNNMLIAMDSIKESSANISKIIKVIDDIAFQTNLLALNAAVEAARAGQQGKGFSVVAQEVRNLAGKSKESAKETALLIEESVNRVNEGISIANQTAEALKTILNDVSNISGFISDITKSSNEQSAAIGQVTEGLSQITGVVQDNSSTSEEAAAASQELSSQAEMLQKLIKVFKLKKFINKQKKQ